MNISSNGLDLIKEFEGCCLRAYICAAGVLTIGYGSTGPHVKSGMTISQKEAEELLLKDIAKREKGVSEMVKVNLNQGQFDALVSFSYNVGLNALKESTLLRLLNAGQNEGAASQFSLWVKAGAITLKGLVRRRAAEESLFRSGGMKEEMVGRTQKVEIVATIKAKQNTLLKKEPIDSTRLKEDQVVSVEEGKVYNLVWRGKVGDNHIKVSLAYGGGNWFIYEPHWKGIDNPTLETMDSETNVLKVPYFPQRDNYRDSWRTCFSSSCAMLLEYLRPGTLPGTKGDDKYVEQVFKTGDTTDFYVQIRTLAHFGVAARFVQDGTNALLKEQIDKGTPVPVGILHKGSASAPTGGGHWLVVIGYDEKGFICHDPWGEINHSIGRYNSSNGEEVHYSYSLFDSRWTVASDRDGWCIIA